jgi:queuine tRNA-ribosyltransferase
MSTTERLIASAQKLIRDGGPEALTSRAVCTLAGVTAPTLYHHFETLDGLLDAAVAEVGAGFRAGQVHDATDTDAVGQFLQGWDEHVGFAAQAPQFYAAAFGRMGTGAALPVAQAARQRLAHLVVLLGNVRVLALPEDAACDAVWALAHGAALLHVEAVHPPAARVAWSVVALRGEVTGTILAPTWSLQPALVSRPALGYEPVAMSTPFSFSLHATDGKARTGVISTPRGEIRTPAFMPVGTAATVKAMLPESVAATGADILLGNTYHLMLRPTAERIDRLGGLHKFMNWDKPILTDSGGFQVMSLASLRKLTEEGVRFSSHVDGSKHMLTPERSMEIQRLLGSDIVMCFDECPALPADDATVAKSMRMSMRWAQRSREAFGDRPGHALFGIMQGGVTQELRAESAAALKSIGFDGYAVGGLAVGEGQEAMFGVLDYAPDMLPADKPRYLMGVGKPDDIVGAVARGIDMMDCVLPSRSGRTGQAWTRRGHVNIKNARHQDDPRPLDENCTCPACRGYSRAYLHHVFRAQEMISGMLLTWHNLHYFQELMAGMRAAIAEGRFADFVRDFEGMRAQGDIAAL